MQSLQKTTTTPKEPPSEEKLRLELEQIAKLPLSRPQLRIVCEQHGAKIRSIQQLKSA